MKYPKIPGLEGHKSGPCVVFEKLDGSNLCFDWNSELGFWRYTTRSLREFDESDPDFGTAIPLFTHKYAALHNIFVSDELFKNQTDIKVFVEFLGPSSFAGIHLPNELKDVVLIDIILGAGETLSPFDFVKKFQHLGIPRILANGRLPPNLIEQVKANEIEVNEGIIIKGGKTGQVWMCKVKRKSWLEQLEKAFKTGFWIDAAGIKRTIKEELL